MNVPNALTLVRIILIPVFVLFYVFQIPDWNLWAAIVFIAASVTDLLDGYLARKWNQITDFGKLMDPMADKLLVLAALLILQDWNIIPFWVMRMMFSGIEHVGEVPFKTVLIHGLIRDSQGRKMSKSLGNGIDPLEVISQFGADALRLTLITGNAPGSDMRYSEEKMTASRNFANKLWNASRFVHMNIDDFNVENKLPDELETEDKWIISTLNQTAKEVAENLDKFELGIAVSKVYDFIWDCYCDWYIELAKARLQSEGKSAQNARQVLV